MSEPEIEKHGLPVNPKKNHYWIWVYAVITLLTAAGITIMLLYNHFQQLTPEQLHSAWDLWKAKGPKSYKMTFNKRFKPKEHPIKYKVTVIDNKVTEVKASYFPYDKRLDSLVSEETEYTHYSMDGMFRDLERFMEVDKEQGKKYLKVIFKMDKDGRILELLRVVDHERRLQVELEKLEPLNP